MKINAIKNLCSEFEKLPIGCLVWQEKESEIREEVEIISKIHNTKRYSIDTLYKPISRIIDFL